jgi:uncharacterized protein YlxW (UPF0749 family)
VPETDLPADGVPEGGAPEAVRSPTALARHRLAVAFKPRWTRTQAAIACLFVLLGLGLALQVRTNNTSDTLTTARESDLVRILDDLTAQNERLAGEQQDLQVTRDQLANGTDQSSTALEAARQQAATLGILAGTVRASGPGLRITISDPAGKVGAAIVLDTVQELRDAGAEVIQIGTVRVVASTSFADVGAGSVTVDGVQQTAPYTMLVIGDPTTMSAALRIPGGVVETVHGLGGDVTLPEVSTLHVDALRAAATPQYSRPSASP